MSYNYSVMLLLLDCYHLKPLKFKPTLPYAFTEHIGKNNNNK